MDGVEVRETGVGLGSVFKGVNGLRSQSLDPQKALQEAYYANVYVYACVQAIATDLAARPFRVGADPENPNDYDPNHPLAVRLGPPPGGPNNTTSARRLWAWTAAQRIIFGSALWEVLPNDLSFWPLPMTDVTAVPQDDKRKVPQSGWFKEYVINGDRSGKSIKADRVFHTWKPSADDWTRYESTLQAAKLDIQVAVMQDIYDNAFLRNDARPAAIVVHQRFQEEDDKNKFRRQFLNRHQGPGNAGRVAFVESSPDQGGALPKDSVYVQTLGLSQRDAQFIERYEAKLRSITVAFGVPLSRLGDASKRTFSNADRETLNYWLDTVQPLAQDIADDVNLRLMPQFDSSGNVGWFDFSGVSEMEKPKRFSIPEVLSMKAAGVLTLEESRKEIGVPIEPTLGELPTPTDNSDDPAALEPGEGVPSSGVTPAIDPTPSVAVSAGEIAAMVQAVIADEIATLRAPEPPLRETPGEPDADVEAQARAAYEWRTRVWETTDRTVRSLELAWERRFQKLLDRQQKAIVDRLNGKRGRQALARDADPPAPRVVAEQLFDYGFWQTTTAELFDDLYTDTQRTAFSAFDVQFGVAFDVDSPFARDYVLERSNYLAGNVTETTYDGLKKALADGIADGESIPDLADRIRSLFNQTYASRAETVARTEVISAYNGSTWLATQNAPEDVIGGLQWISTRDDRTRPTHAAMDGATITRNQAFELDGATLMYPGDPEVATRFNSEGAIPNPGSVIINCRCTIAPILVEDMPPQERSIRMSVAEKALIAAATGTPLLEVARSLLPATAKVKPRAADQAPPSTAPVEPSPNPALVRDFERDANGNIIRIIERQEPAHADD